jgi:hypothetical protein
MIEFFVLIGRLLVFLDRERASRKPDRHIMRVKPGQLGGQLATIVPSTISTAGVVPRVTSPRQ